MPRYNTLSCYDTKPCIDPSKIETRIGTYPSQWPNALLSKPCVRQNITMHYTGTTKEPVCPGKALINAPSNSTPTFVITF